jgi:hypothetical protein
MDLVLRFSFAAQVIAALVIFVLGYVGLFATLLLAMVVARAHAHQQNAPPPSVSRIQPATKTIDASLFPRRTL